MQYYIGRVETIFYQNGEINQRWTVRRSQAGMTPLKVGHGVVPTCVVLSVLLVLKCILLYITGADPGGVDRVASHLPCTLLALFLYVMLVP